MSFSETIFLFLLALLVFGPKKLPEIARQIGRALNEFKRASNEFKAQIEAEVSQLEFQERERNRQEEEQKLLAAAPPAGTIEASGVASSPESRPENLTSPPELNSATEQTTTHA
jgi:sec-independent protein translocase protein TatB